jgi:hypothetical protein
MCVSHVYFTSHQKGCADVVGGLFENKQKDDVTFACKLFEIFKKIYKS